MAMGADATASELEQRPVGRDRGAVPCVPTPEARAPAGTGGPGVLAGDGRTLSPTVRTRISKATTGSTIREVGTNDLAGEPVCPSILLHSGRGARPGRGCPDGRMVPTADDDGGTGRRRRDGNRTERGPGPAPGAPPCVRRRGSGVRGPADAPVAGGRAGHPPPRKRRHHLRNRPVV